MDTGEATAQVSAAVSGPWWRRLLLAVLAWLLDELEGGQLGNVR